MVALVVVVGVFGSVGKIVDVVGFEVVVVVAVLGCVRGVIVEGVVVRVFVVVVVVLGCVRCVIVDVVVVCVFLIVVVVCLCSGGVCP